MLISRALRHQFIIPDFEGFTSYVDQVDTIDFPTKIWVCIKLNLKF